MRQGQTKIGSNSIFWHITSKEFDCLRSDNAFEYLINKKKWLWMSCPWQNRVCFSSLVWSTTPRWPTKKYYTSLRNWNGYYVVFSLNVLPGGWLLLRSLIILWELYILQLTITSKIKMEWRVVLLTSAMKGK